MRWIWWFAPVAAALCVESSPVEAQRVETAEPAELPSQARVRIQSGALAPGWWVGDVGRARGCRYLNVTRPESEVVFMVPLKLADTVQISSLYPAHYRPGQPRRVYEPGDDLAGEEWEDVDMGVVRITELESCREPLFDEVLRRAPIGG
jgi:hypothetical protein